MDDDVLCWWIASEDLTA